MPSVRVNGTTIFYTLVGNATPPLLLMHGGLGFDHSYFRPALDSLGDCAQLIYYDHRGNGASDGRRDMDRVDHATWAADADALRAQLGHERIILFGHSYGAFLAQEYVVRYPERVCGLILCSAALALDYPQAMMAHARARATASELAALELLLSRPATSDQELARAFDAVLPIYFAKLAARDRELVARIRYSAAAFNAAVFRCLATFNVERELASVRAPTLILTGRHDWITPVEQGGQRLAVAIPNAELIVFENSGHFPFLEENEQFVDEIRRFVARVAGERRYSTAG